MGKMMNGVGLWACVCVCDLQVHRFSVFQLHAPQLLQCQLEQQNAMQRKLFVLFIYMCFLCVFIRVCVCLEDPACVAEGLNAPAPAWAHRWDGSCINGTPQWINGEGLASRQAAQGRQGWEAGRGRTGFILSRNAFQCVSGELKLPSCTPARWIDSRRIAGEPANYATARLSDTNADAGGAATHCCMYHIISLTL